MADVSHNGRELNYASANIKIRFRDTDGVVLTYTKAQLDADGAKETAILTKMGISATTIESRKTAYAVDGGGNVLDEDDNLYVNTWETGKAIKYVSQSKNTSLFVDAGATP